MTAYIVVGAARTGTSLTMGVLTKMGVYGGDDYRVGSGNPEYFEDSTLFDFINCQSSASDVVRKLAVKDPWGIKHPRIVFLWEKLKELIVDPKFIVTYRRDRQAHYKSFTRAIRKTTFSDFQVRLASHYGTTLSVCKDYPTLRLYYEDWIESPSVNFSKLEEFTSLEATDTAKAFVNPTLKHY